jgi:hypothetical protein
MLDQDRNAQGHIIFLDFSDFFRFWVMISIRFFFSVPRPPNQGHPPPPTRRLGYQKIMYVKVTPHRRATIGENRWPYYQKLSEIRNPHGQRDTQFQLAAISKFNESEFFSSFQT